MKNLGRGSLLLSLVLLWLFHLSTGAQSDVAARPLHFRVGRAPELGGAPASGRLIVFLSSKAKPQKELGPGFNPEDAKAVWMAAKEIRQIRGGQAVDVDPDELSFPQPFSQVPKGDYQAMALLDINHDYAYAGSSAGDLRSAVVALKQLDPANTPPVELTLNERVAAKEISPPSSGEMLDFVSPTLSAFWGRPIHMRGVVLLPPSYGQDKQRRYATVYWTHGFGATLESIEGRVTPAYREMMAQGKVPEMIYVLLDQTCPGGTHEFADSVNNGPWGKALTRELIPHLESRYRMEARPSGRLLTGHSSGGWAALWLQVQYPQVFGGSWPTSPDPADFRSFTGPNLRADPPQNFYRKPDGSPWMLVRMNGHEVMSLEDFARQEQVLGEYGGQIASFEWVFSPRGKDGRPQPIFNRSTGAIDPEVAQAWEKYDIADVLRRNAFRLRPLLQDKIHLIVGTADTFHLDEPARLLEQTMKELGIRAHFTYLEGRSHSDLYRGGLAEQIAKEMERVAHPAKPAKTGSTSRKPRFPARGVTAAGR